MKVQAKRVLISALVFVASATVSSAADQPAAPAKSTPVAGQKLHYKTGKEVNFEDTLIHGQLQKPELLIVTGNGAETSDGLLRLRENFLDRMSMGLGEEVQ